MGLNYYVALKELKCAIYDGLEMELKVTKMFVWDNYVPSMVQQWWCMICLVVLCLLWFPMWGLERSPKVTKTVLPCALSSFPLPNGPEMSPFTECDVWVTRVLKGIWNWLSGMVLKELIFEGSLPWRMKTLFNVIQGSWNESKIHCMKWSWKNQFCWR